MSDNDALKRIDERIVAEGETLPSVTLKDGSQVQTGTVAAMLQNIERYNRGEQGEVESDLRLATSTLFKVGLFK